MKSVGDWLRELPRRTYLHMQIEQADDHEVLTAVLFEKREGQADHARVGVTASLDDDAAFERLTSGMVEKYVREQSLLAHATTFIASQLSTALGTLVRIVSPHKHEGMIICRDHLQQIAPDDDPPLLALSADLASFWGDRCLMCGTSAAPDRLCENESCRRPLHPQWPAVYCCNNCALEDV